MGAPMQSQTPSKNVPNHFPVCVSTVKFQTPRAQLGKSCRMHMKQLAILARSPYAVARRRIFLENDPNMFSSSHTRATLGLQTSASWLPAIPFPLPCALRSLSSDCEGSPDSDLGIDTRPMGGNCRQNTSKSDQGQHHTHGGNPSRK